MTGNYRPKLLYVAQRHPRYAHDDFIRRWRQHASLGMSQARWRNVARYLHCDRIEGLPASVATIECDGIAIVLYRSEQARQAHIADESARQTMKADELDTFAQPVANTSLLLREETERDGPLDAFRLFVFWSASGGAAEGPELPSERWHALLEGTDIGLTRNHPAGRIGRWECSDIVELTGADIEPLCALATRLETELGGEGRLVLTRTVVLHDVGSR